jgi:hypothetical protein
MIMRKVFISYSHQDEKWKDRLVKQLSVLENQGLLSIWVDDQIMGGDDTLTEIARELDNADIAILLVSADFLTSKFIMGKEVPRLLQRRIEEGVRVIPLIISPCTWQAVDWLRNIQGRPKDNKPLSSFKKSQYEQYLADLALEIIQDIEETTPKIDSVIDNNPSQAANNLFDNKAKPVPLSTDSVAQPSSANASIQPVPFTNPDENTPQINSSAKPKSLTTAKIGWIKTALVLLAVVLIAIGIYFVIRPPDLINAFLQGADSSYQITTAKPNKTSYRIDIDKVEMDIETNKNGYLTIFSIGSSGKLFQIFPNDKDSNNQVEANKIYRLPRPTWVLPARGPAGTNQYILVLAKEPDLFSGHNVPVGHADADLPNAIINRIITDLKRCATEINACPFYGATTMIVQEVD